MSFTPAPTTIPPIRRALLGREPRGLRYRPLRQLDTEQPFAVVGRNLVENAVPVRVITALHHDQPLLELRSFELVSRRPFTGAPRDCQLLQVLALRGRDKAVHRLTRGSGARKVR